MRILLSQKFDCTRVFFSTIPQLILFVGLTLRLSLVYTNSNFDFESYKITADSILNFTPPWRSYRYNYGLPWSIILGILRVTSCDSTFLFRLFVTLLLAIVDLLIALLLARWFGTKVGSIFFLNPISILISGHYIQFDNLALLIGMGAICFLVRYQYSFDRTDFNIAVGLFALSLSMKHTLFFFILWFVYSNLSFQDKLRIISIPNFIFVIQFIPFMLNSRQDFQSISSSVFKYWSSNNAPFWKFWFWDKDFAENLGDFRAWHHGRLWMILMLTSLMAIGYLFRKQTIPNQFAIYSIALLIFASAITSQFLAISCIGAAVFFNFGFGIFFVVSSYFLLIEPAGLSLNFHLIPQDFRSWSSWNTAPSLLIFGSLISIFYYFRRISQN